MEYKNKGLAGALDYLKTEEARKKEEEKENPLIAEYATVNKPGKAPAGHSAADYEEIGGLIPLPQITGQSRPLIDRTKHQTQILGSVPEEDVPMRVNRQQNSGLRNQAGLSILPGVSV